MRAALICNPGSGGGTRGAASQALLVARSSKSAEALGFVVGR